MILNDKQAFKEIYALVYRVERAEDAIIQLNGMIHRLREDLVFVSNVVYRLLNGFGQSAKLTFAGVDEMPASIALNGKGAQAVFTEFAGLNETGAVVPPVTPVAYSSSDVTIATVDPASGAVTAVAVGTATISGTDSGSNLSASDTITVTPAVALSASLVLTAN